MEAWKSSKVFSLLFSQLLPSPHAGHSVQWGCARNHEVNREPEGTGMGRDFMIKKQKTKNKKQKKHPSITVPVGLPVRQWWGPWGAEQGGARWWVPYPQPEPWPRHRWAGPAIFGRWSTIGRVWTSLGSGIRQGVLGDPPQICICSAFAPRFLGPDPALLQSRLQSRVEVAT